MRRTRRWLRILAGLVVLGGLVAVAMWPRTTAVEIVAATRRPLTVTIDEDGHTRVRERFVVASPVSGELRRIALKPGDRVAAGQMVASIHPAAPVMLDARSRAEAEAAALGAESARSRLEAERGRAATALARATQVAEHTRTLAAAGAVPRDELEARMAEQRAAEDALRAADFAIAQAKHDLDVARARLAPAAAAGGGRDVLVSAPVSGVVLKLLQESQAVVAAGQPLVEIGDPARLEIVTDFLSSDAVRMHPGSEILVEQWGGPEVLKGRVRRIEPSGFTKISALGVEEQRVNVISDFEAVPAALGDGFRVEVRVIVWHKDDVLTIPQGSLFRLGTAWAVYVVDGGRARIRQVTIGQRGDSVAEVLNGLDAGTTVVLYPPDTLKDGDRVESRPRAG